MILLYAGLQTLPDDVMEAARVDGANAWQRLTRVMLPLLAPMLFINLVIVSIETFNTFDMVLALTGGGQHRRCGAGHRRLRPAPALYRERVDERCREGLVRVRLLA